MRIFLTGATGFVGINTVFRLKKRYDLTLLVRNPKKAEVLFGKDVRVIKGDLHDEKAIKEAAKDADCVLHIAGLIKSTDPKELYRVNRDGSKNIARITAEYGIKNVIYISSLAARGPDGVNHPISHYGYSKRLGEYEFLKYHAHSDLKILRPTIVYGPYEKWFFTMFKAAKRGFALTIRDVLFSFVHVYDVTKAIELLINHRSKKPVVYTISDGSAYFWDEVMGYLFEIMKVKQGLLIPLPKGFLKIAATFANLLGDKAPITPDKVREIDVQGWCCGFDDLYSDTGFYPGFTLEDGLRHTYDWYRSHGWL